MRKILFLCGKARHRSPTAADIAETFPGVAADYAGLSRDADIPLGHDQIRWADLIVVMERRQKARLTRQARAALKGKRVIAFEVPDRYRAGDPDLVARLTPLIARLVPAGPLRDQDP